MKLTDLFNILSEHDNIDVYRDGVLVAQYDGKNSIDEIYNDCSSNSLTAATYLLTSSLILSCLSIPFPCVVS